MRVAVYTLRREGAGSHSARLAAAEVGRRSSFFPFACGIVNSCCDNCCLGPSCPFFKFQIFCKGYVLLFNKDKNLSQRRVPGSATPRPQPMGAGPRPLSDGLGVGGACGRQGAPLAARRRRRPPREAARSRIPGGGGKAPASHRPSPGPAPPEVAVGGRRAPTRSGWSTSAVQPSYHTPDLSFEVDPRGSLLGRRAICPILCPAMGSHL